MDQDALMSKRNYSGRPSHRAHAYLEYLVNSGRASWYFPLYSLAEAIRKAGI
jgi:hypothetical protein